MAPFQGSCRVCHRDTGRLVSPCACEGSMKYVHSSCLSSWVFFKRSLRCEVCGAMYSVAKVLSSDPQEVGVRERFPTLAWICARRYIRQNLDTILLLVFRLQVFTLLPVLIALLQCVLDPFISVTLPWWFFTQTPTSTSGFSFFFHLKVAGEFLLFVAPLDVTWDLWSEWCISHGEAFPDDLQGNALAEGEFAVNEPLFESDSEEYGEGGFNDEDIGNGAARGQEKRGEKIEHGDGGGDGIHMADNHLLELATLPEENTTILEAIANSQRESHRKSASRRLIPSALMPSGGRLIMFYVSLWVFLFISPEVVLLAGASVWRLLNGSSFFRAILERVLLGISSSKGTAQMRYDMLLTIFNAINASTVVSCLLSHGARMFSMEFLLFFIRRMPGVPKRGSIISMLVFVRGVLNICTLIICAILSVCLGTTILCMDFFSADALFSLIDENMAWDVVHSSPSQGTFGSKNFEHSVAADSVSLPVTVLKALSVISRTVEQDVCWNYGDVHGNRSFVRGEEMVADNNDPLLFPIFAATTVISKIDSFSLISSGHVAVLLSMLAFYHVWGTVTSLPAHWFRWSALYKLAEFNVFQMIYLLDVKMLLHAYGEIVLLIVFTSCVLLRYSLALVHAAESLLFSATSLQAVNTSSSACWLRALFLVYTAPQDAIDAVQKSAVTVLGKLFEISWVTHGGPFTTSSFLSRVVCLTAFAACYWVSSVLIIAMYAFFSISVVNRRIGFLRGLIFAYLNLYRGVRFVYPNVLRAAVAGFWRFKAQFHSLLLKWRRMWWFSSSLGLWVTPRPMLGDGLAGYNVECILELPVNVRRVFASAMEEASSRAGEYVLARGESRKSIQRIQQVLKIHDSRNHQSCFLLEEDVIFLLELIRPPGVLCCLCFFSIWTILLLVLPFIFGSTLFSLVRSLVAKPRCYTASVSFPVVMWVWGAALTALLSFRKPQRTSIWARARLYLFCGCQSFTVRDSMSFIVVPAFMQIGSFSIVPHVMCNVLMPLILPLTEQHTGTLVLILCSITAVLNTIGIWRSLVGQVFQQLCIRFHDLRRGRIVEETVWVSQTEPHEHHITNMQRSAMHEDNATSAENKGRSLTGTLAYVVGVTKRFCLGTMRRCWGYFQALRESSEQLLRNVANRENVVCIVFVNRG